MVSHCCLWALCFLKHHGFLMLFLGIMLSQAVWFLGIVFGHYVFSSVMVYYCCLWVVCFFKHCGFSTLFLGTMLSQGPWFFRFVFIKDHDFLALFFQHNVFSSTILSWLYSQCCIMCFFWTLLVTLCYVFCTLRLCFLLGFALNVVLSISFWVVFLAFVAWCLCKFTSRFWTQLATATTFWTLDVTCNNKKPLHFIVKVNSQTLNLWFIYFGFWKLEIKSILF